MNNKILFLLICGILLIGSFICIYFEHKIRVALQYDSPIGPTQKEPYILDSKIKEDINFNG